MKKNNPRKVALEILIDIETNRAYSNITINKLVKELDIDQIDRRFITQLVYGVLENKLYLDYIIKQFSKTKFNKINIYILNILRLGLYQIVFLSKIPNSAAVNESVKLAKVVNRRLSGFVNGILRSYIRNKDNVKLPDFDKDPIKFLSIKYSHPEWLVKIWLKKFGPEFTEELLKVNNEAPNLTIRTNTLKISRSHLIDLLTGEGARCREGMYTPEAVIIENLTNNLNSLDSFNNGLFQVQDESSMLVGHILDPKEGDFVIDVCSAPGGKSTHIAQLMNNEGKILSRDIHDHKLNLIRENASRLGISIIETENFDALKLDDKLINRADKVLVDAPCSGFGIIRRKPEIKYFKCSKDINNLAVMQLKILNNSSKYVKIGGSLVYCTCTIQDDENIGIIHKFLENNSNFILLDVNSYLPNNIKSHEKFLQLYPHLDRVDGFFICKLKRIKQ
ncbi:MAG: rRNA (cytosine967-C5)-methyltransferase [Candidatus Petromonas sp.]|jgi:16S rRNA (cytosine967-C5)-methyltransferase|nr:rRNA (cytosine967-C5)-methyltransferase [Candidatus Petromonas sp.]